MHNKKSWAMLTKISIADRWQQLAELQKEVDKLDGQARQDMGKEIDWIKERLQADERRAKFRKDVAAERRSRKENITNLSELEFNMLRAENSRLRAELKMSGDQVRYLVRIVEWAIEKFSWTPATEQYANEFTKHLLPIKYPDAKSE